MSSHIGLSSAFSILVLFVCLSSHPASAQAPSGCTSQQSAGNRVLVVRCRAVSIEIERGADLSLLDRDRNGEPDAVMLRSGAVYVDDFSQTGRRPFQIRTPHAVAAVRGTSWAVDVTQAMSSVFVSTGTVGVRRLRGGRAVSLTAGEGVDVRPGTEPLTVTRWGAARVQALLARFGR